MENNLNQILIEGKVEGNPRTTDGPEEKDRKVEFIIVNSRFSKNADGEWSRSESRFPVVCLCDLANCMAGKIKKGDMVRVIGRISSIPNDDIPDVLAACFLIAEHIVLRPSFKEERERI